MLYFLILEFEHHVGITHRLPVAEPGMVRLRCHQVVGVAPSTSLSFHHHFHLVLKKISLVHCIRGTCTKHSTISITCYLDNKY